MAWASGDLLPLVQSGILAGAAWLLGRLVRSLDRLAERLDGVDRRVSFLEGARHVDNRVGL